MTARERSNGEFCWINVLTPRPDAARAFFASLLGWEYQAMPGMGHLAMLGGEAFGGVFDLESPQTPPGTQPHIGVMVKVASADATVERVRALGGSAKDPFDIMEQGRMAVCTDPNGAEFDIWEPKKSPGTRVDSTLHGAPSWFETITDPVSRAAAFYRTLFGWSTEVMQMPGFSYTSFMLNGQYVAGMLELRPEMLGLRPHWGVYVTVRNVDDTAQQAVSLGAQICVPPRDIPGVGRFCGVISPQGVAFYPISYVQM